MKTFWLVFIVLFAMSANALNRYAIKNEITGLNFGFEADAFPAKIEPEWGLKAREIPCTEVPSNETARISSRRIENSGPQPVQMCQLPDQFTVTTTNVDAEKAAEDQKKLDRKARIDQLKALADKQTAYTAAEMQALLKALAKQLSEQ